VDWWSISLEARADGPADISDAAVARLLDLMRPYEGVVSARAEPGAWTATMKLESEGPAEALAEAARLLIELAASAGMPVWPLARAEVIRDDIADSSEGELSA